jgi:hypothetical protein
MDMAMHGPDEGDVIEQGRPPLRLPPWVRPAAFVGMAALIAGLAAGYALGQRHAGQPPRPAPAAAYASSPPGPGPDDLFGLAQTGERPNRHHAAISVSP